MLAGLTNAAAAERFHFSCTLPGIRRLFVDPDEASGGRLMRDRPAEIDLGLDDLAVPNGQDLGIAKALAAVVVPFIGHEHMLAVGHQIDELEGRDLFAI